MNSVNELIGRVERKREAIRNLAHEHHVSEIAYCGQLGGYLFFVVEAAEFYSIEDSSSLTNGLGQLLAEPTVVMEANLLEGFMGEVLRKNAMTI